MKVLSSQYRSWLEALWKQDSIGRRSGCVRSDATVVEEVLRPFLDALGSVRLHTTATQWSVPGRYGPYGELFFFLLKKEPMVLGELVRFGRSIPVEAVKACALVGLHMMAEEDSWRTDSGFSFSSRGSSENKEVYEVERRRGRFGV